MKAKLKKGGVYYIDGHFYRVAQAGSKRVRLGYINLTARDTTQEFRLHYTDISPEDVIVYQEVEWENIKHLCRLQEALYRVRWKTRFRPGATNAVHRDIAEAIADRRSLMDLVRFIAHEEGRLGRIARASLLKCHLEIYDGLKVSDYIKDFMERDHDDE